MPAVIDDQALVFTLINTFLVAPDRQGAVVGCLKSFTEQHARLCPGFVAASVHASLDGSRVVNYVQWQTEADLAAIMASPQARAHVAEVAALTEQVDPVIYQVAFVGSRERAAH
jgi:antibiotic biosynthesis monooxygenase (ABM) superfamily enzyme